MHLGIKTLSRARPYNCKPMGIFSGSKATVRIFWGWRLPGYRKNTRPIRLVIIGTAVAHLHMVIFPPPAARPGPELCQIFKLRRRDRGVYLDLRLGLGEKPTAHTFGDHMCSGRVFSHGNLPTPRGATGEYLQVRSPPLR